MTKVDSCCYSLLIFNLNISQNDFFLLLLLTVGFPTSVIRSPYSRNLRRRVSTHALKYGLNLGEIQSFPDAGVFSSDLDRK